MSIALILGPVLFLALAVFIWRVDLDGLTRDWITPANFNARFANPLITIGAILVVLALAATLVYLVVTGGIPAPAKEYQR